MAMSFLKVYFDFEDRTEMLNEVEQGRLLLTMLRYAQGKTLPELKGNERYLFPVFKGDIDRERAAYATKVENGAKGGRPAKSKTENNLAKPNETERNRTEPTFKNKNLKNLKNKTKELEEQEQEQEHPVSAAADVCARFPDFWAVYPNKVKKQDAQRAWKSAKLDGIADRIIADVRLRRDTEWKGQDMHYIPHPTTYLHQRRWEDETAPTERKDGEPRGAMLKNPATDYQQRDYKQQDEDSFFLDLTKEFGGE